MSSHHPWKVLVLGPATLITQPLLAADTPPSGRASDRAVVSLRAFMRAGPWGTRAVGGMVVVRLPLDRFLAPASRHTPIGQEAPENEAEVRPAPTVEKSAPRPRVPPPTLAPEKAAQIARACVRAAWRAHGVASFRSVDDLSARARTSAVLPDASVRVARGWDESYRLSPTDSDPYRTYETTGGRLWVEGRLTWRLDRLVFAKEELSIERLRNQRIELRTQLAGHVLKAFFSWQRARMVMWSDEPTQMERLTALVEQAEAHAQLDVLTGGWFSRFARREVPKIRVARKRSPRRKQAKKEGD